MLVPSFVRTHHRASIPHRLGPLPRKCYSMVSAYECRHTVHTRVLFAEKISNAFKISSQCIPSIPHRLGPLPSECYTMNSMRTHHGASIQHRLRPLPSECYSMESTYKCRYTLHARVASATTNLASVRTHRRESLALRLGPLASEFYSMVHSPC